MTTYQSNNGPNQTLRQLALAADAQATSRLELSTLWSELLLRECHVVDEFFSSTRCFLLTSPGKASGEPLAGRRLRIVEDVLAGTDQKNVAIDLALAPSTVALNARLALHSLGVHSRPSRVHPLLMLAARAARIAQGDVFAAMSGLVCDGQNVRVVSIERPDCHLDQVLPPAELSVIRSLVEGQSYSEIATKRGTSTRTIANQIAAVFRRMRVSGRSSLLLRLFDGDALGMPSLGVPSHTLAPSVLSVSAAAS